MGLKTETNKIDFLESFGSGSGGNDAFYRKRGHLVVFFDIGGRSIGRQFGARVTKQSKDGEAIVKQRDERLHE
jgi:hypothetical protein